MALLKIVRGSYEEISKLPIVDGTLLFATDEHRFFLDQSNERIEFTSGADLTNYVTQEQLEEILNELNRDYVTVDHGNISSDSDIVGAHIANGVPYNQRVNIWTEGSGGYGLVTEDAGISLYHGEQQQTVWSLFPDLADGGVLKTVRGAISDLSINTLYNLSPGAYLVRQNATNAPSNESSYGNLIVGRVTGNRVISLLSYDNGHIYANYGAQDSTISNQVHNWKRIDSDGGNSSNVVMVQSSQPTDTNCKIWIQI